MEDGEGQGRSGWSEMYWQSRNVAAYSSFAPTSSTLLEGRVLINDSRAHRELQGRAGFKLQPMELGSEAFSYTWV